MNAIMSHRFSNPKTHDIALFEFNETWIAAKMGDADEERILSQEELAELTQITVSRLSQVQWSSG